MTSRKYNFSPGPAVLPEAVLERVRENILSYNGTGIGIMEMSHRGKIFEPIVHQAEADLRELLGIPDSYAVLFLMGGATMQFSMVPMNLLQPGTEANYLISGFWSDKAATEARKFGEVHIASSSKEEQYRFIPKQFSLSKNPAYLHFTSNNTIVGTQYHNEPAAPLNVPLAVDASSDILCRPLDVSKYGVIYACAQKNVGPAGVTIVIIRRDLLDRAPKNLPVLLNYNIHAENSSLYNTPPCFAIYVVSEVLQWLKAEGGLTAIEKRNRAKATKLYDLIDEMPFYSGHAAKEDRSLMNVVFRLPSTALEELFVKEADDAGMHGLKGHKLLGGIRASIYNAFPEKGVDVLVSFMRTFAAKHG